MAKIAEDETLSSDQKIALVIHELRLMNALPEIPPLLRATWPFPGLNSNDLSWLERKRKDGTTDWPWFASAIEFLKGEGVPQSDFERVKSKVSGSARQGNKRMQPNFDETSACDFRRTAKANWWSRTNGREREWFR